MRPVLCLLLLSGCTATDPLYREGLWRPVGANQANLVAMVADPQDLVNGVPTPFGSGGVAAEAVARYRADKVKALPDSGVAKFGSVAFGVAPAASAAAGSN